MAPARSGNKHLKRAFFLSAFAALRADPISRAYYDRKRAEGKKYNAALICLVRRRCDVYTQCSRPRPPTSPDCQPPLHSAHRDTPVARGLDRCV